MSESMESVNMPKATRPKAERFLRIEDIVRMTGISAKTILRHEAQGLFPSARKIGRLKVWIPDEVEEWLRNLPKTGET